MLKESAARSLRIVQLTPGAGGMFCGNCLRDNALTAALMKRGHQATLLPLYLPLNLDESDLSAREPIFFSGINVYLEQKMPWFRRAPEWLRRWLSGRGVLKMAASRAARTRAEEVGDLTLSMLRGEQGNQAREIDELLAWLKSQPPADLLCLSNVLLSGMARRLKAELGAPVVCSLQGEQAYVDSMPEPVRSQAWQLLAERAADIDLFIAPSQYFAQTMSNRLGLPSQKVRVVYNGIDPLAHPLPERLVTEPVIGYFARMCRDKGLDLLVEAFIRLRRGGRIPGARLLVGGNCTPADEPFVASLREKLRQAGLQDAAEFHANVTLDEKKALLRSMRVFSVPAMYGEAFGLYLLEAWAAGLPVVQPSTAAFPELLNATGAGLLFPENDSAALAENLELLLMAPDRARHLGSLGRKAVETEFSLDRMAANIERVYLAAAASSGQR